MGNLTPLLGSVELIGDYISRVVIFSESVARRPIRTRHPGRSLFGRIGWQYHRTSKIHAFNQVYPEQLKNVLFHFVFEGALSSLIEKNPEAAVDGKKIFQIAQESKTYSTKDFTEHRVAESISDNPKTVKVFENLRDFAIQEEAQWTARLTELDFADAKLISDLI